MGHDAQLILAVGGVLAAGVAAVGRAPSADRTRGFSSCPAGRTTAMYRPPDTLRIVFGYDGSDAARRGLARVRQLAAKRLAVLVVAVEPEIRSPGLGSDLAGRTIAIGRLL